LSAAGVAAVLLFFLVQPIDQIELDRTVGQNATPVGEGSGNAASQDIPMVDRNSAYQSIG
jgi:hypothetical protein